MKEKPLIFYWFCKHIQIQILVKNSVTLINKKQYMKKILIGSLATIPILADLKSCSKEKCPDQWTACGADANCQKGLSQCFSQCKEEQACWAKCLAKKQSQAGIMVALCSQGNGCLQSSSGSSYLAAYKCAKKACPNQWKQCDTAEGKTCAVALVTCMSQCQSDELCWVKCLKRIGDKKAFSVALCAQPADCLEQPGDSSPAQLLRLQKCIESKCPAKWESCKKEQKCVPALKACQKKCKTKESCYTKCIKAKSSKSSVGVALCAKTQNCIQTTGPKQKIVTSAACAQQKCPKQWGKCQKEEACTTALFDCASQCDTDMLCWIRCLPGKKNPSSIETALCASQCL